MITLINQASANIFKAAQRSANKIRINSKTASILETYYSYYHKDKKMLGDRYKIVIDENLSDDEIWVYYDGRHGFSEEDDFNNRHAKIKILNFS